MAGRPPPRRFPPWVLLAVVCVGQFMVVLDISIVNVALPAIRRDLGFSTSALQWVVNAYALSFGGFLLLGGRAADLFGRKRIFLLGLGLFGGASLVCAMSQDQGMLVAARALQGFGGAVLAPATLTLLTTAYAEPRERARALGIWSAMAAAGGASGALLGGVLTDLLSWRWIFLINVPIAALTLLVARVALVESRSAGDRVNLDVVGALTVTGGLVAFVYAVAGTATRSWTAPITLVSLGIAVVLFVLFGVAESRPGRHSLVPFRLFRSRSLSGANLAMLALGGSMFAMWLFLSLYLQDVLHFSPLMAGFGFLPQTLAIVVGAQISSRLVTRVGPKAPLLVGLLFAAGGLAWLSQVAAGDSYWTVAFGGGILATFGMGLSMTPLAFAATSGVAPQDAGLASGVLNTSRQVGGSIGLAALATIASSRTAALLAIRRNPLVALTDGFGRAFAVASVVALVGVACALIIPPFRASRQVPVGAAAAADAARPAARAPGLQPVERMAMEGES